MLSLEQGSCPGRIHLEEVWSDECKGGTCQAAWRPANAISLPAFSNSVAK